MPGDDSPPADGEETTVTTAAIKVDGRPDDLLGDVFHRSAREVSSPSDPPERDRGLLAPVDRRFLRGEWSTDSKNPAQMRSNRKRTLRNRVVDGFEDFRLLPSVDKKDAAKIYNELGRPAVRRDLASLVAFVYQMSEYDRLLIEEAVADGIFTVESQEGGADSRGGEVRDVTVNVTAEFGPDVEEIHARYREEGADALSPSELGALVRHGDISEDELRDLSKPPDVRDAEQRAVEIEGLIEKSEAATFDEWKSGIQLSRNEDGDLEGSDGVGALTVFASEHPDKDIRDYISDEYITDDDGN